MGDKPRNELLGALHSLYESRDYSDLVIFANDGSRHPVHRAIVCPRSQYFYEAVKNRKWRDGNEGHIALTEDEPDVVHYLVSYFYLLDYEPIIPPSPGGSRSSHNESSRSSHGDLSDSMSVRTEAGTYGHVYGASAVSAFGGPAHSPQPPFSTVFRNRADSSLTIHAVPGDTYDPFGRPAPLRQTSAQRSRSPPNPSPLASDEPNLVLHAKMYAAGERYSIKGLKALALDKFKIQLTKHWNSKEFPEAIHTVYDTTHSSDKDMREAVADTLGWHSRLLEKPEVEVAVMEINGLAYELLKRSRRAEPEYM